MIQKLSTGEQINSSAFGFEKAAGRKINGVSAAAVFTAGGQVKADSPLMDVDGASYRRHGNAFVKFHARRRSPSCLCNRSTADLRPAENEAAGCHLRFRPPPFVSAVDGAHLCSDDDGAHPTMGTVRRNRTMVSHGSPTAGALKGSNSGVK
ncbi:unnamed protein product [Urochloa humidicola]